MPPKGKKRNTNNGTNASHQKRTKSTSSISIDASPLASAATCSPASSDYSSGGIRDHFNPKKPTVLNKPDTEKYSSAEIVKCLMKHVKDFKKDGKFYSRYQCRNTSCQQLDDSHIDIRKNTGYSNLISHLKSKKCFGSHTHTLNVS